MVVNQLDSMIPNHYIKKMGGNHQISIHFCQWLFRVTRFSFYLFCLKTFLFFLGKGFFNNSRGLLEILMVGFTSWVKIRFLFLESPVPTYKEPSSNPFPPGTVTPKKVVKSTGIRNPKMAKNINFNEVVFGSLKRVVGSI